MQCHISSVRVQVGTVLTAKLAKVLLRPNSGACTALPVIAALTIVATEAVETKAQRPLTVDAGFARANKHRGSEDGVKDLCGNVQCRKEPDVSVV